MLTFTTKVILTPILRINAHKKNQVLENKQAIDIVREKKPPTPFTIFKGR
jgi:hypothetical protein